MNKPTPQPTGYKIYKWCLFVFGRTEYFITRDAAMRWLETNGWIFYDE